ncbi:membrane protein implicated in regulation of membrane protease activity [Psychromicrobium silvestre]|uniref:Membrane protein implicated in regulation of membrane protease activity n=1 Tax=Psychromicrobium silvestre TaxID=1645614 RepID=A0A7Y9LV53_9MICC|nr:hypothetical protein [Psychromicrobium silvestre]NYE96149.1 membrane protein implicated in regulation of membrane protease activity [Psychromicrobium silvestre]
MEPPRSRAAEQVDIGIGFIGFWALILLVTVLWQELSGSSALGWALVLAASVLVLASLFRLRYKVQRRDQQQGKD